MMTEARKGLFEERKKLFKELKKLGVENPSRMYPVGKMVAGEEDPSCTVLRMKMHIEELQAESNA